MPTFHKALTRRHELRLALRSAIIFAFCDCCNTRMTDPSGDSAVDRMSSHGYGGHKSAAPLGKATGAEAVTMRITRTKIVALVIALAYVAVPIVMSGWDAEGIATLCLMVSLPLAFIWFPEEISAYTARLTKRSLSSIDTPTPGPVVTLVGWVWLVGYLPLLAYLLTLSAATD
jgi:hypothetical protein